MEDHVTKLWTRIPTPKRESGSTRMKFVLHSQQSQVDTWPQVFGTNPQILVLHPYNSLLRCLLSGANSFLHLHGSLLPM